MKRCKKCNVPLEGVLSKILNKTLKIAASDSDPLLCNRCTDKIKTGVYTCQICNRSIDESLALSHIKAEEYLLNLIKKDHPEWKQEKGTCQECIDYYRALINKAKI